MLIFATWRIWHPLLFKLDAEWVDRNLVEARKTLRYLVLVKNCASCVRISKELFLGDASLKKVWLKTSGSFCYCSKFACISATYCCFQHFFSKHIMWQSSSKNGTTEVEQTWCIFASEGSTMTWKKYLSIPSMDSLICSMRRQRVKTTLLSLYQNMSHKTISRCIVQLFYFSSAGLT